ncbi:MAG: CoA transferase [Dehalococcoidia bacterium]|nr:CoA transferase [Dehalococcoidia bacterium]
MVADGGLSDLKIVELGNFISAAFCAKLMGDLGAEVIKLEEPGRGDDARRYGPFCKDVPDPEASGLFLYLNTNKLGVTLNVKSATGKKVLLELLKDADIFVHNKSPKEMEELGLTYDVVKEVNPRLIMTSITYFGQYGPYRDYKGSDLIALSMGGVAYGTPIMVEEPEKSGPLKGGGHQADFTTAAAAATSTMMAVFHRMLTDEGQHVDISSMDVIAALLRPATANYFYGKMAGDRTPASRTGLGTSIYQTTDGFASFGASNDGHWLNLVKAMGEPEWATNPLFGTREGRAEFGDALKGMVADWASAYPKKELYTHLQSHHVPSFPVNKIDEVVASEHLDDRGFFVEVDHPKTGKVKYPGYSARYSEPIWGIRSPAPFLGQHNEEVLSKRLGYTKEELVQMRQLGVI